MSMRGRLRLVRASTIARRDMTKLDTRLGEVLYPERPGVDYERPRTRGECEGGERPCPYVSCKYNLYLDVSEDNGSIKLNFPDLEPSDLQESCVLDAAAREGMTLEETAVAMNVTRERVRQIEARVLDRVSRRLPREKFDL